MESRIDMFRLGGSLQWFDLRSECVNGKYGFVRVFASALVAGYGAKASGAAGGVQFDDGDIDINPDVFTGTFRFFSAGLGVGVVGSYSYIQLGDAFSVPTLGPPSPSIGFDASVAASLYGRSAVISKEIKSCQCVQR